MKCNEVLALALKKLLTKNEIPRGILYGPDLYEGLNIKHPYYSQGIIQLMACIQECAISSQTGQFIQQSAESFILELGYPVTLGNLNYQVANNYLTPSWYRNLAKFVSSQVLDVKGKFKQLELLQQSDKFLMLSFIEQGYRKELLLLNKMRMSIQAISLANIVTSNGFKISQNIFFLLSTKKGRIRLAKFTPKIYEETDRMLAKSYTGIIRSITSNSVRQSPQTFL